MKAAHVDIESVLAAEGVISRRRHPELDTAVRYRVSRGQLVAVLPGIYARPEVAASLPGRLAALRAWDPDAVVTGAAAAHLTFWRDLRVDDIECLVSSDRAPHPGFRFSRRRVPPELIVTGNALRVTSPALTALDLSVTHGADAIDVALRSRLTTLHHLYQALDLCAGRRDNRQRRQLLLDSRAEPWSAAERSAHRELRAAGITGWRANRPVTLRGQTFYLDIGFGAAKIDVEIDGREFHIERDVFEIDRRRQNLLVLDGWLVLRFTWRMLEERPQEFVDGIREALAIRGAW